MVEKNEHLLKVKYRFLILFVEIAFFFFSKNREHDTKGDTKKR